MKHLTTFLYGIFLILLGASVIEGVLLGLKICKEMWAQGTISHENIYENEAMYNEELNNLCHSKK